MYYYAHFDHAADGITVTFPDIPEAMTCAQTEEKAMVRAEDVLLTCVELYFDEGWVFPRARAGREGETAVYLPETVYAKILLHNTLLEKGESKANLARLLDTQPPEVQRILNVRHKTRIDTLGRALAALGRPLHLSV